LFASHEHADVLTLTCRYRMRLGPCRYEGGEEPAEGSGDKGTAGALLAQIRSQLFSSGAFARLVKKVGGQFSDSAAWLKGSLALAQP
jgi:hypothetical protein